MEGIEFEKEVYRPPLSQEKQAKKSWAIRLVIRLSGGRIKTDEQASLVIGIASIIFLVFSIYKFMSSGDENSKVSKAERFRQQQAMEMTFGK